MTLCDGESLQQSTACVHGQPARGRAQRRHAQVGMAQRLRQAGLAREPCRWRGPRRLGCSGRRAAGRTAAAAQRARCSRRAAVVLRQPRVAARRTEGCSPQSGHDGMAGARTAPTTQLPRPCSAYQRPLQRAPAALRHGACVAVRLRHVSCFQSFDGAVNAEPTASSERRPHADSTIIGALSQSSRTSRTRRGERDTSP
jgi:hypothetical protein